MAVPPEMKDFKQLITAMENWSEYIFNYFDHPKVTNAFTESSNRGIKDIQRMLRNGRFETVRAKAIYGTAMRKQLRAARAKLAKKKQSRETLTGSAAPKEQLMPVPQRPVIQMALF